MHRRLDPEFSPAYDFDYLHTIQRDRVHIIHIIHIMRLDTDTYHSLIFTRTLILRDYLLAT